MKRVLQTIAMVLAVLATGAARAFGCDGFWRLDHEGFVTPRP